MKTHILCLGDSNTHGYCADPKDNADGGIRFNEDERWTCRLQTALGDKYLVTEEGLSGRTTVFVDPIHESMDALSVAYPLLKNHEVIDLLIIMLGTNDVKERFNANAACIGAGMERLIQKCKTVDCWGGKEPNILVVAPPRIKEGFHDEVMGDGCVEKSKGVAGWYKIIAERNNVHFLSSGALEGLGKGVPSLVISLCRYVVFILPLAAVLCGRLGPDGVWHAFWITEVLTALVAYPVYHRAAARH